MKKLLFSTIICSILLWSCEKHPGKLSAGYPVVDRTKALKMIKHYLDSNVIRHDSTIVRQTPLSRGDVLWALADKNTVRVQVILSAYLDSEPDSIRNQITVLLQLKKIKKSDTSFLYFDLNDHKSRGIRMYMCPPPNNCEPEGPENFVPGS